MKRLILAAVLIPALALAAGPAVFADGFKGTENLAFDGKGGLYVSDAARLWKVEGGKPTELFRLGKGDGNSLGGVAVGPGGLVYFSIGKRIMTYDPATSQIEEFAAGFKFANGICFDDSGNLYVADTNGANLYVVPAGTRAPKKLKAHAGTVNGVVWSRELNALYYTVMLPGEVRVMALGPGPSEAGDRSVQKFPRAILDDLTLDGAGNVYVCQYGGGRVVRLGRNGFVSAEEAVLSGLDGPSAAEFGPDHQLYVAIKGKTLAFNGATVIAVDLGATAYRQPFLP